MKTNRTSKSPVFLNIARLVAAAAGLVVLSQAAIADPRPGNPGNQKGKPSFQEVLEARYRHAPKTGTPTAKGSTANKVPCNRCTHVVRTGKLGK